MGRIFAFQKRIKEVENWEKGKLLQSNGWLLQWAIEWAEVTYKNGRKGELREIYVPSESSGAGTMFRNDNELMEIESHLSFF